MLRFKFSAHYYMILEFQKVIETYMYIVCEIAEFDQKITRKEP